MSPGIEPHDIPSFYVLMNPTIGFISFLLISDLCPSEIILSDTQFSHSTIKLIYVNAWNFKGGWSLSEKTKEHNNAETPTENWTYKSKANC